jgi:opacity protein-like surface antigen
MPLMAARKDAEITRGAALRCGTMLAPTNRLGPVASVALVGSARIGPRRGLVCARGGSAYRRGENPMRLVQRRAGLRVSPRPSMRLRLTCFASFLLITLTAHAALAQKAKNGIELSGVAGYQLSPSFDAETENGTDLLVRVEDSATYGVVVGRLIRPGLRGELSWRYQPTHLKTTADTGQSTEFDLYVHHLHSAATYERGNERVRGFALVGVGATLAHPGEEFDDSWFFSFAFALGLKLQLTELLGIRAESRLTVPIRFSEGGMWCNNVTGCVAVVSDAKAIAQVDFVAGPVLSF